MNWIIAFLVIIASAWGTWVRKQGAQWPRLRQMSIPLKGPFIRGPVPWQNAVFCGRDFNGCMRVGITADTLYIAPMFPFSLWQKPIAIPIRDIRRTHRRIYGKVILELAGADGLYIALAERWVAAMFERPVAGAAG